MTTGDVKPRPHLPLPTGGHLATMNIADLTEVGQRLLVRPPTAAASDLG
jgi:hypothetical protein